MVAPQSLALTARQTEVVGLVARGYTNKEIATVLGITERGVDAQVSRLLQKFGVPDRAGLIAKVLMAGGMGLGAAERPALDRIGAQARFATLRGMRAACTNTSLSWSRSCEDLTTA